jgi:hypothetical protein
MLNRGRTHPCFVRGSERELTAFTLLTFAVQSGQGSAGVFDGPVFGASVFNATAEPFFDGLQSGLDAGWNLREVHLQNC